MNYVEVGTVEEKNTLKIILITIGSTLLVAIVMLALLSPLQKLLAVEVKLQEFATASPAPLPKKPQDILVTAYYEMEKDAKKISAVYIEIFSVGNNTVHYFEVPADTKINLSEELYKSLQTYGPELPQYLKLSNMAESFSEAYGLTAGNRILSEILGFSITEYVRADKETLSQWFALQTKEVTAAQYFEAYTAWIQGSVSSRKVEERWTYYESRRMITERTEELAAGQREKDGYLLSGKRSGERLKELMLSAAGETE